MHKNYPSNNILNFRPKLYENRRPSNPSNTSSFFEKNYDLNAIDLDRPITLEESDTKNNNRNDMNNSKGYNSVFERKNSNSSKKNSNFYVSKYSSTIDYDIKDNNKSSQNYNRNINKNQRRKRNCDEKSHEDNFKTMKSSTSSFNIYSTSKKNKGISFKRENFNVINPGIEKSESSSKQIPFVRKKNVHFKEKENSSEINFFVPKKKAIATSQIPLPTPQNLFGKEFDMIDKKDKESSVKKIPTFSILNESIKRKQKSSTQLPFLSNLSESTTKKENSFKPLPVLNKLSERKLKKGYSTKQLPLVNSLNENTIKKEYSTKELPILSKRSRNTNTLEITSSKTGNYSSKVLPFPIKMKSSSIPNKINHNKKTNLNENETIKTEKQKNENIQDKKEEKDVEDKEIVKKRRPNFPKYEKRVSNNNITMNKKKEKKPEDNTVKLENNEKILSKRKNSIQPVRRKKSTLEIKLGTELTTNNYYIKISEALSTAGRDDNGLKKTNQDTYVLERNINGILNFNIFGVLDGHGVNGHLASQFAKRYMLSRIKNHPLIKNLDNPKEIYKKLTENRYKIIASIFVDADNQITKEKFNCEMSGTTCNLVIQLEEHIICANTGDSRSILVYDETNNNNNLTKIYNLSYDCKPELPSEKKRIEACGGMVLQDIDEDDNLPCGPFRVWIKGERYPGLAVSRSIGDLDAKKVGVIPNPQIIEYSLNFQSKYMIICSDGIWEYISNEEAMEIANKYYLRNDAKGLCQDLTNISTSRWLKDDIACDDITVVSVFF